MEGPLERGVNGERRKVKGKARDDVWIEAVDCGYPNDSLLTDEPGVNYDICSFAD